MSSRDIEAVFIRRSCIVLPKSELFKCAMSCSPDRIRFSIQVSIFSDVIEFVDRIGLPQFSFVFDLSITRIDDCQQLKRCSAMLKVLGMINPSFALIVVVGCMRSLLRSVHNLMKGLLNLIVWYNISSTEEVQHLLKLTARWCSEYD